METKDGKRPYTVNASDAEMKELEALIAKWQKKREATTKLKANPWGFGLSCVGSIADALMHGLLSIEFIRSLWVTGFSDHSMLVGIAVAAWSISTSYSTQRTAKKWGLSE